MTNIQTKRIEAYAIADFVKQIQEAVLEGYKLNLEDNDKYPVQIGVGYYATLEKVNVVSETERKAIMEEITNSLQEPNQQYSSPQPRMVHGRETDLNSIKTGRKPKN